MCLQRPAARKLRHLHGRRRIDVPVRYIGFEIPDQFIVGYGLDFNNYYRNLPDVVTLKPEVIEKGLREPR